MCVCGVSMCVALYVCLCVSPAVPLPFLCFPPSEGVALPLLAIRDKRERERGEG